MASKKAQDELLKELHEGLARHLKDKLDEGIITTGELNILRQFLKDNNISGQPVENTPFGDLLGAVDGIRNVVELKRDRKRA